jgi:hypothetical protein
VVWIVAHGVGIGAVPYYAVQTLILRGAIERARIERERRGVRWRAFCRFSGGGGVASVFDGFDECFDVSIAIDARLFGLSIGVRVGYAAHFSKRVFDCLYTVAAGHSLDSDGLRHTLSTYERDIFVSFCFESKVYLGSEMAYEAQRWETIL